MLTILLVTISGVALSVLLLGMRVFFTENGQFPNIHIGENNELAKRGIRCMKAQDLQERNKRNIFEPSKRSEKKLDIT